jgi:hypothetical protein
MTEELILELIQLLDGVEQEPDETSLPYRYYATLLKMDENQPGERQYRLVWLLEEDENYIGIITAYRDDRRK